MKIKKLLLFIFVIYANAVFSQLTPQQMAAKMGKGINLGNTLEAPTEGEWRPVVDQTTYFKDIKAAGFKHVRIPVRWGNQTTPSHTSTDTNVSAYTVSSTYLDRVEAVVDAALAENLVVILDAHHEDWFVEAYDSASTAFYVTGTDRDARLARFKAIWTAIAARFQSKSDDLIFEIINEPYFHMSKADMDALNPAILSIIRTNNPTRKVVVVGGTENNTLSPQQLDSTFLQGDNYLMATFHFYDPFDFTSSAQLQYTDNDWGTATDKLVVDGLFNDLKTWSQNNNNIPVFMGEFGADNEGGYNYVTLAYGTDGGPTEASRNEYYRYICNAAVARGFVPCAWDAGTKSKKALFLEDSRTWVESTTKAMLGLDYLLDKSNDINFTSTTEGWTGSGATVTQSNGELVFKPTTGTAQLRNTTAGINANLHHKVDIRLKNNTTNAYLRISFPDGNGGTVRTFVNSVITTQDADYKTYRFDLLGKTGWTGQVNDIRFHLKLNATTNNVFDGSNILIDQIRFSDGSAPVNYKKDFTFDTTKDSWDGINATVTPNGAGLINVNCNNGAVGGVTLTGAEVDSYPNYWMHITLQNQSTTNDQLKVLLSSGSGVMDITTNDAGFTTYHMNLGQMGGWQQNVSSIQFLFYNKTTGVSSNSGDIIIDRILFDPYAPASITYTGDFDFRVDGQPDGWVITNTNQEQIINGILSFTATGDTPKMSHLSAGVNAANKYAVLYLKNSSSDNGFKLSYPNGTGGRTYRNFAVTTLDTEFKKYIVDMSGTGWTGTINDIQLLFATGASAKDGSVSFDYIRFVADPYGIKNTYDFTNDNFGWKAATAQATTTSSASGMVITLDKNNQYPAISSSLYSVNATGNKWAKITLNNNSTCNKIHMKMPDATLTTKKSMVAGVQTIEFDLSSQTSWTGTISPSAVSFNFTLLNTIPTGSITISNISFYDGATLSTIDEVAKGEVFEIRDGVLTIQHKAVQEISIYAANGSFVKSTKTNTLVVDELVRGIYFVLVKMDDGSVLYDKIML